MTNTIDTIARRGINFNADQVKDILPEYFTEQYPNLITFLEKYYDYLDSDQTHNFNTRIKDMFSVRDVHSNTVQDLDRIFYEIGIGIASSKHFRNPRYAARTLAQLFRVKGSLYSSEAFFKEFYNVDAEIEYPKRNIFIVGESQIGAESLRYIQNGALYQIYSILIKSEVSINVWRDLYKNFAHPAGFYIGSNVFFTCLASNLATVENNMPTVLPADIIPSYSGTAIVSIVNTTNVSELIPSDSAGIFLRTSPYETLQPYSSITIGELDAMYQKVTDLASINSFGFDQDDDSSGRTMDMSSSIETFDQVKYSWRDSDSA